MRIGTISRLVIAAGVFITASTAKAHFIYGSPDAPAHNLNHAAPVLGLGVLAAVVGFAAYRCYKGK